MRIGAFTRYTRSGASSRLRFLQYFSELVKKGFDVYHESLLPDSYITSLQSGGATRYKGLQALIRRAFSLRKTGDLDVIWMEKDALPWLPTLLENMLIPKNTPLVLDYDDAVFHEYDMHSNPIVRQLLKQKHQDLMRKATLVVTGNQYIADYARRAGANRVEILPTVVDLTRYKLARDQSCRQKRLPIVGWIGQRSTAEFLRPLAPLFARLNGEMLMRFKAIGIDAPSLGLPMSSVVWSEQTEVDSIQKLDVGIMPLDDGLFERGKCGYKLIQYMACGLPIVASPVGVNTALVEHGVNGFLAASQEEWEWALRTLAKDPMLRHRMGQAGRIKVEREYSLQVTAPILAGWLAEATRSARV